MELFVERIDGGAGAARGGGAAAVHRPAGPDLAAACSEGIEWAEQLTARQRGRTLFVGVRLRRPCRDPARRRALPGGGEEEFRRHLYAPDIEDPELIIRTGGELRLSNFLLWQSAYSELYFSDMLWPDFDRDELERALDAVRLARAPSFGAR